MTFVPVPPVIVIDDRQLAMAPTARGVSSVIAVFALRRYVSAPAALCRRLDKSRVRGWPDVAGVTALQVRILFALALSDFMLLGGICGIGVWRAWRGRRLNDVPNVTAFEVGILFTLLLVYFACGELLCCRAV
jgi:hypothetical protein